MLSKFADEVLKRLAAVEAAIAKLHNGGPIEPPDRKAGLLPDRLVAQRYDVTVRTLERWDKNPDLKFPPPVYILRRRYRDVALLDQWDKAKEGRVEKPHHPGRDALYRPRAGRGRFNK